MTRQYETILAVRTGTAHPEFSGTWIPCCSAIEAKLLANDEGEIVGIVIFPRRQLRSG
jgi:hypothetical protein